MNQEFSMPRLLFGGTPLNGYEDQTIAIMAFEHMLQECKHDGC